ncbi:MAG: hypothetical protein PHD04_03095 [Candidatus Pacebacteria bacterium]|nr:hypothetical protein [Candidatus Paceibacterota bacterium]
MLLPKSNSQDVSGIELFDALIKTGEEKSFIVLPFQLHTFLVNCLAEHMRDRAIGFQALALGLLDVPKKHGERTNLLLKRTGDAALILAGLFPERALRLHVSSGYFRFMGQAAYMSLAGRFQAVGKRHRGEFYDEIAHHFHFLEKVLNAVRARPETEWEAYKRFRIKLT